MFGCIWEVRMAIRATGWGRHRNGGSGWFSVLPLSGAETKKLTFGVRRQMAVSHRSASERSRR